MMKGNVEIEQTIHSYRYVQKEKSQMKLPRQDNLQYNECFRRLLSFLASEATKDEEKKHLHEIEHKINRMKDMNK